MGGDASSIEFGSKKYKPSSNFAPEKLRVNIFSTFWDTARYSGVSQFLDNAREIFEAAETSAAAGHAPSEYTILIGAAQGGIRMIANSDWSLGALQREHGAQLAYRVSNVDGRLTVDGREGQRTCHMETTSASKTAQFLLNAVPAWHTTPSYAGLLA
jgi:hypothetical protein